MKNFQRIHSEDIGGQVNSTSKKHKLTDQDKAVLQTVNTLIKLGCPPLPVAPKQDPRKKGCHHQTFIKVRLKKINEKQPEIQGEYCRISTTKVGDFAAPVKGDYCRLDENLQPIPRFTGKNPSYIDINGDPRIIPHAEFQKRMTTAEEKAKWWWTGSPNGVGTLGGHAGVVWLDFDRKNYPAQEDCDRDVERIRQKVGATWVERTGSCGARIAVRPKQTPTFTNFDTDPSGERHIGEALSAGRFTVLAPTIHPNGTPYKRIEFCEPAEVESLESIDIFPTKDELNTQRRRNARERAGRTNAPSNPTSNPFDVRNFVEYLEGNHVDGNYIKCRCPHHQGVSDNSMVVHIETGAVYCHRGCDPQNIIAAARREAIAQGYKFPELPKDKTITRKLWLAKGFGKPRENELTPAQKRERSINKRMMVFRSRYWEARLAKLSLKEDFSDDKADIWYEGWCPILDLGRSKTFLVAGWLGAGKTEAILRSLAQQYPDKLIVWVTTRNGLLYQTIVRATAIGLDGFHYQDDVTGNKILLEADSSALLTAAVDSFKAYSGFARVDWSKAVFVVDEWRSVRTEILSKPNASEIFPEFERALKEAETLIVADAFLSKVDRGIIRKYRGRDRIVYRQKFKKSPKQIKWIEAIGKGGEIALSHDGAYLSLVDQMIESGGQHVVGTDNLSVAQTITRYIQSKGKTVKLVCYETPETNGAFMSDPDEVIEIEQPDFVIYTPTAQAGLDIQSRFDSGLLIATGVLKPCDMLQMLGRPRQCNSWTVMAPRFTTQESLYIDLDGNRIAKWADQLAITFESLVLQTSDVVKAWATWQNVTDDIEKAFNSEYLYCLLEYFFESVEPVTITGDRVTEWRELQSENKSEGIVKALTGDIENGQRLIDEQKAPKTNREVYDIKAAKAAAKHGKTFARLKEEYDAVAKQPANTLLIKRYGSKAEAQAVAANLQSQIESMEFDRDFLREKLDVAQRIAAETGDDSEAKKLKESVDISERKLEAIVDDQQQLVSKIAAANSEAEKLEDTIKAAKIIVCNKTDKLKAYLTASNDDVCKKYLKRLQCKRFISFCSPQWKRYVQMRLIRELRLDRLAAATRSGDLKAGVNAFNADDPIVSELYEQFRSNRDLAALLPFIENLRQFWLVVCRTMNSFGFESCGKKIRVKSDQPVPNGYDRKGNRRYSKSKVAHFSAWYRVEESGSALMRAILPDLVDEVKATIEAEEKAYEIREARRAEQEREAQRFDWRQTGRLVA